MIRVGDDKEYLEIQEMERIPSSLPSSGDVRVRVAVQFQQFSGSYEDVWLSRDDLKRFLQEFKTFDETRKGSAKLEAMSPNEFLLELRQKASLNQFEIAVQLGRHQHSGSTYWPILLSGGFELNPSQIEVFRLGMESLII